MKARLEAGANYFDVVYGNIAPNSFFFNLKVYIDENWQLFIDYVICFFLIFLLCIGVIDKYMLKNGRCTVLYSIPEKDFYEAYKKLCGCIVADICK